MSIRTIEATVIIEEDRKLVVQLPADIPVGAHHVVAVLDQTPQDAQKQACDNAQDWQFPLLTEAKWPADMPLSREEFYDDDGR